MTYRSKTLIVLLIISFLAVSMAFIVPSITGFVTANNPDSYRVLNLDKTFVSNDLVSLPLDYPLESLKIDGRIIGSGKVKIYLVNNFEKINDKDDGLKDNNLLVYSFDSSLKNPMNGFIIKQDVSSKEELNGGEYSYYVREFNNYCSETCWLNNFKNPSLKIIIDGDINLYLKDVLYQMNYPIVQKRDIEDFVVSKNSDLIIDLSKYFMRSDSLKFTLPKIVGINAEIINGDELYIHSLDNSLQDNLEDFDLFVNVKNDNSMVSSNTFRVCRKSTSS